MTGPFRQTSPAEAALVLRAVRECPHRGPVLPHARQPECGCAELSECRAGDGRPESVTLEACVGCRWEALGLP